MISSVASAITIYEKVTVKYNLQAIKSVKDAMINPSPCLVSMKQEDPLLANKVVELMIAKTARAFNLPNGKNIEPEQIQCLVEDVMSEFYFFKLSDVFFILKQARLGRIEKIMERLDQPTIWKWFEDHAAERLSLGEKNTLAEHDQLTYGEKDRKYDGYISKLYSEQQNEQNKKVMNIAYGMAKKMANNSNPQASIIINSAPKK
jgi:hypothetical protein